MKLYRSVTGHFVEHEGSWYDLSNTNWDDLTTRDDLPEYLQAQISKIYLLDEAEESALVAPIAEQEVWAAGVTYFRSRTARMEESQTAGGGSFYDRVYHAERPELFFKSSPHRVVGDGATVHIRRDSKWNVPEPELALLLTPSGKLIGYTVGNDMSSRDIEGENPLYLPQAKVYDRSCALGPGILVSSNPLALETCIRMEIVRDEIVSFSGQTTLAQMKRTVSILIEYLFRENTFPNGCFLLTGTGVIPPDDFTLQSGDEILITIDEVGTLQNFVG